MMCTIKLSFYDPPCEFVLWVLLVCSYRYYAPEDYDRLSRFFPASSRSTFEPRDDGYYYFARVSTKN